MFGTDRASGYVLSCRDPWLHTLLLVWVVYMKKIIKLKTVAPGYIYYIFFTLRDPYLFTYIDE